MGVTHKEAEAMKIAVVRSRGLTRFDCGRINARIGDVIVSGGARGVDSIAAAWARRRGIPVIEHKPDYARYGKAAPHVRNDLIVAEADRVVAFWDGRSRGTQSTIRKALKHGKPVDIVMC